MSSLLKQKAKVGVATKERKTFDVADVFKRVKKKDGTVLNIPQEHRPLEEFKEERKIQRVIKPKMLEKYDQEMKK